MPAYELVEWLAWFELNREEEPSMKPKELTADQQYAQMRKVLG